MIEKFQKLTNFTLILQFYQVQFLWARETRLAGDNSDGGQGSYDTQQVPIFLQERARVQYI